jgi:predicted Zn-dependent peptidase
VSKPGRLTVALAALALAAQAGAADPTIAFEKYQLANGLTVILSPDHRLPQVVVNVWYHVGAANQAPGRSGFAHLFEHMMFSGSKHVQPSPFKVLESIGAAGGALVNGSTSFDRTNYYEVVPSNELATALWVESDRLGFLLDTLDGKKLQIQRDVVSNERRQSYENRPYGLTRLRTCDLLYPSPHPYYQCVIGSIPEIQAASVDDVKSFFREFYAPQNASLAIVGDFEPAEARALVERYFGPIPAGPPVARPAAPQPKLATVVRETLEDPVAEVPRLDLIWNGTVMLADDEPAGDVLAEVLAGSDASRLTRSMVHGSRVAAGVSAGSVSAGLGGWFQVTAMANGATGAGELLAPVQAAIDELKKTGPTHEEVERARRQFIAARVRGVERIASRAELLNGYQTYRGDPGWLAQDLARYRAVTPEAVQAFARKYLADDRRIELTTLPKAKVTK